jgi:hypothetical protein
MVNYSRNQFYETGPSFPKTMIDKSTFSASGQCYKTFLGLNYVVIGVTSVKIIGIYTASGVNYVKKVL